MLPDGPEYGALGRIASELKLFLAQGNAKADAKDSDGRTPHFYAAEHGHEEEVKLLLAQGDVKADAKDSSEGKLLISAGKGESVIDYANLDRSCPHPPRVF